MVRGASHPRPAAFERAAQLWEKCAASMRNKGRNQPLLERSSDFALALTQPQSLAVLFFRLACRLRGTRAKHRWQPLLAEVRSGQLSKLSRSAVRDAYALYCTCRSVAKPRAGVQHTSGV